MYQSFPINEKIHNERICKILIMIYEETSIRDNGIISRSNTASYFHFTSINSHSYKLQHIHISPFYQTPSIFRRNQIRIT